MLTIGEFSRLTRTTPRMLRHYDALGLLHPDTVGENGYRYYRQEQLSDLVRIQWLSGYGFALHEIGPLLGLEDGALLSRLHQRREALRREQINNIYQIKLKMQITSDRMIWGDMKKPSIVGKNGLMNKKRGADKSVSKYKVLTFTDRK